MGAVPISLRLDPDLLAAIDAAVDGGDRSAWIKGACRMRLGGITTGVVQGIEDGTPDVVRAAAEVAVACQPLPTLGPRTAPNGRKVPGLAVSTRGRLRRG